MLAFIKLNIKKEVCLGFRSLEEEVWSGDVVAKVNVQEDYVYMVVMIPPRIAVANAIQYIKTHSAKKGEGKIFLCKKPMQ